MKTTTKVEADEKIPALLTLSAVNPILETSSAPGRPAAFYFVLDFENQVFYSPFKLGRKL